MYFRTNREDHLSIAGHIPFLAGAAEDGGKLFIARACDLSKRIVMHGVAAGTRPSNLICRVHCVDGSTYDEDLYPQTGKGMQVLCLRYDPFIYNMKKSASADCIDMGATGPYTWKFNRKLPLERNEENEEFFRNGEESRILWEEVIHEPKQDAHIQELTNDFDTTLLRDED